MFPIKLVKSSKVNLEIKLSLIFIVFKVITKIKNENKN